MRLGTIQKAKVEARVEIGEVELTVGDLTQIREGTIFQMNRLAGEPVDFVVAGEKVARGEVVVIDEYFGIRLTQILERGV